MVVTNTYMLMTPKSVSPAPTSPLSTRPVFPPAYWTSPPGCPTGTSNSTCLKCDSSSISFSPSPRPTLSSVTRISVGGGTIHPVDKQEISRSHPEFVLPQSRGLFLNPLGFYFLNTSQIWLFLLRTTAPA